MRITRLFGCYVVSISALSCTSGEGVGETPSGAVLVTESDPPSDRKGLAPTCDPFGVPVVNKAIPTAKQVIGINLGERDITTAESDAYLQAVAKASPLVTSGSAGTSVEGRDLRYVAVGNPKWISTAGLHQLSQNIRAIRDPRTPEHQAQQLIKRTPQVLWVAGNVHGTEESGTDASLRVLYELAARVDCAATNILDNAVVFILPTQNPDGREADTRRNAYGFDMNRDWFARTQPETDSKIELLRQYPPQLFIDAHEMGPATYFFPPNADPVYHEIGEQPLDWIYNLHGDALTAAFTRFGYPFFNGDIYDLFYMGYGDTVPTTGFNAAGMTFEKANADPTPARVQEQYVAIWASLTAAASEGDRLLRDWRSEFVTAQRQGRDGILEPNQLYFEGGEITNQVPDFRIRHYFLRTDDPAKANEIARVVRRLQRMDVDVYQLTSELQVSDFTAYGRPEADTVLPSGTYWIPLEQYQKRWIHAMLSENTYGPFPYAYDVTAWSSPLLANVDGGRSGLELDPQASVVPPIAEPAPEPLESVPTVAVWQGSVTSGTAIESAGWLRWYLDSRLQQPYADVTAASIAAGALAGADVLVVPTASDNTLAAALGPSGQAALAQWVRDGGTLVAFRTSARLAATLGLTTATWTASTADIPGSLVRFKTDAASSLFDGVGPTAYNMVEFDDIWTATVSGTAAASYPAAVELDWFVSGFDNGIEEIAGSAAIIDEVAGAGRVVLFASDPNYRAFTDGTQKILRNVLQRAGTETPAIVAATPSLPAKSTPAAGAAATSGAASASGLFLPDALVIEVDATVESRVRDLLAAHGANAEVRSRGDSVSFRVALGGLGGEEHPWASDVAREVKALGKAVRLIRLP